MSNRRFAKQHATDLNQPEIILALNEIGCTCYEMEQPVDLLVEYEGKWIVLEVKNPKGKNALTKEQEIFFSITEAPAYVVRSPLEAVTVIKGLSSRRYRK